MRIVAYVYSEPRLEAPPEADLWGVEVDQVYQDWGQGGQRPQLAQLLATCAIAPPQYLLVRRLEELGDTLAQVSAVVAQLEAAQVALIVTSQAYPEGKNGPLLTLLAEIQQQQQRRRLRLGHSRNRLAGKPPPGKAPYGYRRGQDRYLLDRSTAPVVKDFFEQFLLYGSLRGAVRYLEKKYGKKITVTTGRRWLTNPVYRGDLTSTPGATIANTHTPILSRDEAAQIDRLLKRNRALPPRTASAPRSLAGLVRCHHCRSRYRVTRTTQRGKKPDYLYLRPVQCLGAQTCGGLAYGEVLAAAIASVCRDLPQAVAQMPSPPGDFGAQIQGQITTKQDILAQLPQLEAQGILDPETAQLRRYKLQTEIAQAQAQLAQLPPENLGAIAKTVSIPQFWWDLSEAERRFYLREFIREIEIHRPVGEPWFLTLVFIFAPPVDPIPAD
ncbi:MAG: recombinase family protein [Spirulina sp. DLM2.Bin59]|nr:MAG: recombinase family protein [Spirulina sp. DLM2.Bin59]